MARRQRQRTEGAHAELERLSRVPLAEERRDGGGLLLLKTATTPGREALIEPAEEAATVAGCEDERGEQEASDLRQVDWLQVVGVESKTGKA